MSYSKDIKFIRTDKLYPEYKEARMNDCDDLWFAKEDELLPIDNSWDTEYVDVVKPEVAIERYENYMKSNPSIYEKYHEDKSTFIRLYEDFIYDRRTIAVAYLKSPCSCNLLKKPLE
jgi:hypothetical protein